MGGGASNARYMNGNQDEIVAIMMPVYYIHDAVVTEDDLREATVTWNMITEDSEEFKRRKATDPEFTHFSCVSWFFNNFYSRLFDVHPLCRSLFTSGLQSQGKFLIKMVSLTLSQLGNQV